MEPPRPDSPQATVALTRDDVKTLSSDTRVEILKRLGERRMTVTELATALALSKATVLEHLEKLATAGFVRRIEDEKRVWVYYELADKGRRIVHQSSTRFVLLLSTSGLAAIGGASAFAIWAATSLAGQSPSFGRDTSSDASDGASSPESPSSGESPPPSGAPQPSAPSQEAADAPSMDGGSLALALLPVAGAACVLLASFLAWRAVRGRRRARDALAAL